MADSENGPADRLEEIAIVGMACRFPGGIRDPQSFWEFLLSGGDAIGEVPEDRWDRDRYFASTPGAAGRIVSRRGGFLADPGAFDAAFFGMSPREAVRTDPQHRWLLELSWETLEDAGIPPSRLRGSNTGVFLGISHSDYGPLQEDFPEQVDSHSNIGNSLSIASNRIAYWYDWKGPALSIDTACSSGLVAVDRACRSLRSGECGIALAGAVSAILLPDGSIGFSKAGMLSPDGECRAFDARANGYVRSEGAAWVLLKPLSNAIADGDRIHATIVASRTNQDGRTSSMPVPSVAAQSSLLESALGSAGIPPSRVVYVEAHGTGTPVGDPVEARAMGEVLSRNRPPDQPCLIGSVKTNIGHLEPVSGLAGLIKAALVVREGRIPPSLHFRFPSPHIDFETLRLEVVSKEVDLPHPRSGPPVVVVNSFGFGGTNAQCLLAPPPPVPVPGTACSVPAKRPLLLPLSATDQPALRELARLYGERAETDFTPAFCEAVARYREGLPVRAVFMGADAGLLRKSLSGWAQGQPPENAVVRGTPSRLAEAGVAMVFTGQGSQYPGMACELLELEPGFAAAFDEVASLFAPLSGIHLREELFQPPERSKIDTTEVAQPAIFAIQYGLLRLWESWGVVPRAVAGHSLGEVAAAVAAGILDLSDAVELIWHRSRLQGRCRRGGMAVVAWPAEEVEARLAPWVDKLSVSAWNSPSLATLAGDADAMEALIDEETSLGQFARKLPGDCAFHTAAMDEIEQELRDSLASLSPRPGTIPFFSTVTGRRLPGETLDADYWWRNVREPVLFCPAVSSLGEAGFGVVLEIGPHAALLSSVRETLDRNDGSCIVAGSLYRQESPTDSLSRALASLWVAGIDPDWESYLGQRAARPDGLPRYPWQHKTFWLESPGSERLRIGRSDHPFLGPRLIEPHPAWETLPDPRAFPWINDHKISNRLIFPASGFAGVILAAGEAAFPGERITLERLEFERFLFIPSEVPPPFRVEMDPDRRFVSVFSRASESIEWTRHARGRIVVEPGLAQDPPVREIGELRRCLTSHSAHWDFYEGFNREGYHYGPAFRGIEQVWYRENEALAEIVPREEVAEDAGSWRFHPALLDASFQALRAAMEFKRAEEDAGHYWLPVSLAEWEHFSNVTDRFFVHARFTQREGDRVTADLDCLAPDGTVISRIRGFVLARIAPQTGLTGGDEGLCELRWPVRELALEDKEETRFPTHAILIGHRGGFADRLASALDAREARVDWIGANLGQEPRRKQLEELLAGLPADITRRDLAILHLAPLEDPEADDLTACALETALDNGIYTLLDIAQVLQQTGRKASIRSLVKASGRADAPGHCRPASAPLTGFLRVASSEMPECDWGLLQLESHESDEDVDRTIGELQAKIFESEVAWFAGARHVARLTPLTPGDLPRRTRPVIDESGNSRAHALVNGRPGTFDRIERIEVARPDPGPSEIEVRVVAAGVNFRDLLKALNRYPGTPDELAEMGDEFAGEVIRTGSGVTALKPGDRVMGVARGTFRSHLLVKADRVIPVPEGMLLTEAATMPTTFLTAHHALCEIARLRPGESILIHAAAGGVGLAAIQVAKELGLEIFATAGSPEKRSFLHGLGVRHVMDSRSLSFAREIREITGGRGVDAVLNSLAGEFLIKSLESLAPFGRFLEIGKLDLHADRSVGLGALRNAVSISVIDMDRFLHHHPEDAEALYTKVAAFIHEHRYQPLAHEVFPAAKAGEVFREMARGRHLGKRVLDFKSVDGSIGVPDGTGRHFPSDATFLVAGGHSGFGFETAKWLVANGVRHLALLSRSGPRDESVLAGIGEMISSGVEVHDLRADLTDECALNAALADLRGQAPPLAGVFHTAMVLDDRFIPDLDRRSFAAALDPKVRGSWFLHQATLPDPLQWFVVYSSFAATAGSPRQANYAAGNSFLEGLMRERHSRGLPGLAIAWGPVSDAGFVERSGKTKAFLEKTGCRAIPAREALEILGRLLDRETTVLTVSRTDWGALARFAPALPRLPVFRGLPGINENHPAHRLSLEQLQGLPKDQQNILIEEFLVTQFSAVFDTPRNEVDRTTPVTKMGLDSLMALELLNRLEAGMGFPFPMGTLLAGPTIRELANKIAQSIPEAEADESSKIVE